MKTVRNQKTSEIKRLSDKEAHKLVTQMSYLGWSYVPKEVWKNEVRGSHSKQTPSNSQEPKKSKVNDTKTRKSSSK